MSRETCREKGNRWLLIGSRLLVIFLIVVAYKLRLFSSILGYASGLSFFQNQSVREAGLVIQVLGLSFTVWARLHLGRNWSARPTVKIGHELVTSGPYGIVRNPILYTGILMAWFGFGLSVWSCLDGNSACFRSAFHLARRPRRAVYVSNNFRISIHRIAPEQKH